MYKSLNIIGLISLGFALGIVADRFWQRQAQPIAIQGASVAPLAQQACEPPPSPKVKASSPAAGAASSGGSPATPPMETASVRTPKEAVAPPTAAPSVAPPPKEADSTRVSAGLPPSPPSPVDKEQKLRDYIEQPFPRGRREGTRERADGGEVVREVLEDGTIMEKAYSPRGTLLQESFKGPAGEHVDKAYDEQGRVRSLSWQQQSGGRVDVKMNDSGQVTSRMNIDDNGKRTTIEYDQQGRELRRFEE